MSGVSPNICGRVFLVHYGVNFGVLDILPVLPNGLVVAFVGRVTNFECPIIRNTGGLPLFLREVSVSAESHFGVVEGASLSDSCAVRTIGLENQGTPINVIIPYHILLPLKVILSVGNFLLEEFVSRPSQEVLILLRHFPLMGSVMHVLEFRLPHFLVTSTGSEHLACAG